MNFREKFWNAGTMRIIVSTQLISLGSYYRAMLCI